MREKWVRSSQNVGEKKKISLGRTVLVWMGLVDWGYRAPFVPFARSLFETVDRKCRPLHLYPDLFFGALRLIIGRCVSDLLD